MTIEVTLSRPPASTTFEVGSFAEAVAILSENESQLIQLFTLADKMSGAASAGEQEETQMSEAGADAAAPKKERKKRAAVEAVAPAPLPVPDTPPVAPTAPAAPAAQVDTAPGANGIPAFLDRTAAPPAPPPLPNAPPLAPAAAPSGVLAAKVVAELETRAKGSVDGGAGLATWLASPAFGLIKAGTGYAEALSVVALATDAQLSQVAGLLKIA